MIPARLLATWAVLLAAAVSLPGCRRPSPPNGASDGADRGAVAGGAAGEVRLDSAAYHLSGPYTHENLAVFLIHSPNQDERHFLTLDEGLKTGVVKVTEQDQAQVDTLRIDNQSDLPLFLQEGERLQGGRQDRTITASLVVPPRSGPLPLPAFCIEHGRWTEGETGRTFAYAPSRALALKGVRGAAKVDRQQSSVWASVEAEKAYASTEFMAPNTNSSDNEMLDSRQLRKLADEFAAALQDALAQHGDAVGVAIVLNGQFEEADIYPNHAVCDKMGPRLIRAYGVQAAMLKDQARDPALPSPADVARLMADDGPEKAKRDRTVDAHNSCQVRELESNRFECATRYDGRLVHWQVLKKNGVADGPSAAAQARTYRLGGDW
jgi:hypothetical protein